MTERPVGEVRPEVSAILADVCRWARSRSDILGVALVGSHASGRAGEESDVDLAIVTDTWVKTDPPAPEVCRIVRNGIVILYDPHRELLALSSACGASGGQNLPA